MTERLNDPVLSPVPYCTNVHAGATLEASLAQLDRHACAVRRRLGAAELPIGWWLAAPAVAALRAGGPEAVVRVAAWLEDRGLRVETFNGFPFGDFHQRVVKHRVYAPDWSMPERLEYTVALAELLAALRPEAARASISTLPIGWPSAPDPRPTVEAAATALAELAVRLRDLRDRTGVRVHVDLEPEPGCLMQRSRDVVAFFDGHLRPAAAGRGVDEACLRDHLGVCHDVCHAAVMFESQATCLGAYAAAGIPVGKMQISSAIEAPLDALSTEDRRAMIDRLRPFAEERYLHQTTVRSTADRFHEDLPDALEDADARGAPTGTWRVHYHVPIHLDTLGGPAPTALHTTRHEIVAALRSLSDLELDPVLEVETYAWDVLPAALRTASLDAGIAHELRWLDGVRSSLASS